ncbi:hypothetical protein V8G61_03530 [Gaetbulibacter sp. M240]|uniref:hypothetical protein n=1 Tax=Gaetbulibacter sp. M240 TaxID=3126511 RepID=UPI00374EEA6A
MRDAAIFISIVFVYAITGAQSNYEQDMHKAIDLWKNNQRTEAISAFETIANSEKEKWLPFYYAAQIKIISSFEERDEKNWSILLTAAQTDLDHAESLSNNNPEIKVLQALLNTSYIAHDGRRYASLLSAEVEALYRIATLFAPENPRVLYCKAEWDMHAAQYSGSNSKTHCADLERALELFAKFKPESPLHPNWGEARAKQLFNTCKG